MSALSKWLNKKKQDRSVRYKGSALFQLSNISHLLEHKFQYFSKKTNTLLVHRIMIKG